MNLRQKYIKTRKRKRKGNEKTKKNKTTTCETGGELSLAHKVRFLVAEPTHTGLKSWTLYWLYFT